MTGINEYSTNPSNNTMYVPEGCAPSVVNDGIRQVQADVRTWYNDAEWLNLGDSPTYVSATSFSVVGNQTAYYTVGRRIRISDSSTLYGTIATSAYTTLTTVTVTLDSGSISASISAVSVGIIKLSGGTASSISSTAFASGAASSTDNAIARFDGTNGKVIQNSAATLSDDGALVTLSLSGKINLRAVSGIVISSGVATLTEGYSLFFIDTEGSAASDDLDTLSLANSGSGDTIVIKTTSSSRDIVVKHLTGNISLIGGVDFTLSNSSDRLVLQLQGSTWYEIARSQLGSSNLGSSVIVNNATGTTSAGDINITGDYKKNGTKLPYIQQVSSSVVTSTTGATTTPFDDTIPQITEGNEFITVTITPTSASNILEIQYDCLFAEEVNNDSPLTVAIFQDSTANAKYAKCFINGSGSVSLDFYPCAGVFRMTAGTTSATTIRLRAGFATGTVRINGSGGARKYGGVLTSSLIVREVTS